MCATSYGNLHLLNYGTKFENLICTIGFRPETFSYVNNDVLYCMPGNQYLY